ncbi:hypothetical protein DPMN_057198 [Dreissena polymorpha]|uniref:Uncharacterized protein n=1 Tax=Dreissena polymorpha TaxID=45954 RepID=A0A9D4CT33_DREPO|nr:hypothetical protein DPMN_057198 [Dreissena polymorpha]
MFMHDDYDAHDDDTGDDYNNNNKIIVIITTSTSIISSSTTTITATTINGITCMSSINKNGITKDSTQGQLKMTDKNHKITCSNQKQTG